MPEGRFKNLYILTLKSKYLAAATSAQVQGVQYFELALTKDEDQLQDLCLSYNLQ